MMMAVMKLSKGIEGKTQEEESRRKGDLRPILEKTERRGREASPESFVDAVHDASRGDRRGEGAEWWKTREKTLKSVLFLCTLESSKEIYAQTDTTDNEHGDEGAVGAASISG
jgi:hypothetical protein